MHVVLNIAYIRSFLYKLDVNNTLTDFSVTFIYLTHFSKFKKERNVFKLNSVAYVNIHTVSRIAKLMLLRGGNQKLNTFFFEDRIHIV